MDRNRPAPTPAAIYAALHTGTPGDLEFYRRLCDEARSVLELGCGHGRVLSALLSAATAGERRLVGVDIDTELLAMAHDRLARPIEAGRVELHRADMRSIRLDERFDRVIMPHTGLYTLASVPDLHACLATVHAHLQPGGVFALDAWAADDFHATSCPEDVQEASVALLEDVVIDGVEHRVEERSRWDHDARTIVVNYELSPLAGGPSLHHEVLHRYWTADELLAHLETSGLVVLGLHGGFDGEPYDADAESMVVVAVRG